MREIKFRARNAELPRCWIYGYFVVEDGHRCAIVNGDGKFKVIAGSEGQFTGLKDKNGKEIYEGDVVRITDKGKFIGKGKVQTYEINYRSGCFMADNICNGKDNMKGFELWDTIVWHELMEGSLLIEVIGNIYESPEPLKEPTP